MLSSNGNQAQYVYFLLSGAVALAIIVLAYISVRTTLVSKYLHTYILTNTHRYVKARHVQKKGKRENVC